MIFYWIFNKVKSFFLFFINLFRRALCCFRKRRNSSCESVPLTHVVSSLQSHGTVQEWSEWGSENVYDNKPKTVQDHIEMYRQRMVQNRSVQEEDEISPEEQLNFFEDMTPKITKQTKLLIRNKNDNVNQADLSNSRLSFKEDTVTVMPGSELGEWDESSGWDGERLLDHEAQKVLREQKRLERERKVWEHHQRRTEKASKALGSKLTA